MQNFSEEEINKEELIFEQKEVSEDEIEKTIEKKEEIEKDLFSKKEREIKEELKEEIEKIKLTSNLADDAKQKAVQIQSLGKKGKLQRLLNLAEEKGIAFAVMVAQNMNDPYILDTFHDLLVKEGFYKKFKK